MKFTREAWENAPEGATLKYIDTITKGGLDVHLIGYKTSGYPVVEFRDGRLSSVCIHSLRIILPKRKVTVQLWRDSGGGLHPVIPENSIAPVTWAFLGEHTFEIEGE